ncbi:hypothetical protein JRO89_XS11G0075100 [Xanthoceras sorbifolium]|uniref:RCC1-like domain-containing protein n=1 Tax=Xanthoceras sorbifolium TaxID=99658 RepID=A0ABQ8HF25_9ROSI|nr:hypothetical protein JRO89_XS11G0075100 [Xanthoceras sorbifolium]
MVVYFNCCFKKSRPCSQTKTEKKMWSRSLARMRKHNFIRILEKDSWRRWICSEPRKRFAALWGNGDYGRLGLSSLESQWRPVVCSSFENQSLKAIACGGAHTLFLTAMASVRIEAHNNTPPLTETGRVYATGLNDFGQLGISENTSYTLEPHEVSGLGKEISQISAGYHHSSAITDDSTNWNLTRGFSSLGEELVGYMCRTMVKVLSSRKGVTVDGELYIWGKNSHGQLGLGKKAAKVIPVPTKVECLSGIFIKLAALGSEHSVAVTDGGRVLSWGGGGSGRLGHGQESSILGFLRSTRYDFLLVDNAKVLSEYTPRLIKKLEGIKVKTAAAGLLHSTCIDENGCVFIFGQRAVDKMVVQDRNNVTTPSLVSELPYSEDVACGGYHTCVVTSGGELYSWGSNENGCLGIGSTDVCNSPEKVQGPFAESPVYKVSCGWKHTAAISEGNVFTWGWGGSNGTFSDDGHSSGGQLGHGNDIDYIQPTMVNFGKNVRALEVSCGFNHTGAILEYV